MLEVQRYLQSGKTVEDLSQDLGIKSSVHPYLPLVILNYDQIESPKTHPIVRECRGLTLDTRDHSVVAKSFNRFFNWGEVQDEQGLFDFSNFTVQTKEDGSLVLIYHFEGHWLANTRGSFATDTMQGSTLTWQDGFCKALGITKLDALQDRLVPGHTYVCEFCSPYNKVVRRYSEPCMYLLTVVNNQTCEELSVANADLMARGTFLRPQRFDFNSIESIQRFLQQQSETDPTFEGVVICDTQSHRWKIKSATYLGLHRLRGEGDNLFNPKHLLPFVLAGEEDELLTYYPEVREAYTEVKCKVLQAYVKLLETWVEHKDIEEQKEFALTVIGKTPFTGILFNVRKKHGQAQKLDDLKAEWRQAEALIFKSVFGR